MVVTRSMSKTDRPVTRSMPKTDPPVTRSMPKTDPPVTRSMPKTDPKIAEQTEKEKMEELARSYWGLDDSKKIESDGESDGETSSGGPMYAIERTIKTDAMELFMERDYLKRCYKEEERPAWLPMEVCRAGQIEWLYLSASDKAYWIAEVKKERARVRKAVRSGAYV